MLEHGVNSTDRRGRECTQRASRDEIDPDIARSKVRGQISSGVLQGRFGNALTTLVYDPRGPRSDVEATAVLLMAAGIDPNVPYNGRRPINWALEREDAALARLLEDGGASTGTTFAHKLRQVRKTLAGAAIATMLLLGGSM